MVELLPDSLLAYFYNKRHYELANEESGNISTMVSYLALSKGCVHRYTTKFAWNQMVCMSFDVFLVGFVLFYLNALHHIKKCINFNGLIEQEKNEKHSQWIIPSVVTLEIFTYLLGTTNWKSNCQLIFLFMISDTLPGLQNKLHFLSRCPRSWIRVK